MRSTTLIPSLLVSGGASTTSIVVSQNIPSYSMNSFIEYEEDNKTPLQSVQKINELIKKVKDDFQKLKKTIENYEQGFKDYKAMSKDEEKAKMRDPRAKELARTNFLVSNLESLLKKEELSNSKKERLQTKKASLEEKIKEIEDKEKEYGTKNGTTKKWDMEEISKLAGDFSKKIQELYEELFLFFKQYGGLIPRNIGINRKKSLSALLSTAEKVGLLEKQENTNYMSNGLKFIRTVNTSDQELMEEIKKNNYFSVDNSKSTLTLKIMDTDIWSFFGWNNSGENDLSDWNSWIKNR